MNCAPPNHQHIHLSDYVYLNLLTDYMIITRYHISVIVLALFALSMGFNR